MIKRKNENEDRGEDRGEWLEERGESMILKRSRTKAELKKNDMGWRVGLVY